MNKVGGFKMGFLGDVFGGKNEEIEVTLLFV